MSNYDDEVTVFDNQEQVEFATLLSYTTEEAKSLPVIHQSKAGHRLVIDLGNLRGWLATDANGEDRLSWMMYVCNGSKSGWKLINEYE
jgi:hypothetical protein